MRAPLRTAEPLLLFTALLFFLVPTCSPASPASPDAFVAERRAEARAARLRGDFRNASSIELAVLRHQGTVGATPGAYLITYTALVTDFCSALEYRQAARFADTLLANMKDALSDEALALVYNLRAHVHECSGEYGKAIHLRTLAQSMGPRSITADELVKLRTLSVKALTLVSLAAPSSSSAAESPLAHWMAGSQSLAPTVSRMGAEITEALAKSGLVSSLRDPSPSLPSASNLGVGPDAKSGDGAAETVRAYLEARITRLSASILSHKGTGWRSILQTPHHFDAQLPSVPWLSSEESAPWAAPMIAILEGAHAELAAEYLLLKSSGLLFRDRDCIQGHGFGAWSRFETTAEWLQLDASGCSLLTPKACAVLHRLRALGGSVVLRMGYSAVEPDTWIQPHFGSSNARLKLHLGLIVPGEGCAAMRVGREWRSWEAGKVLVFDDSFEHEVFNACKSERVVLQVVVRHPALGPDPDMKPIVRLDH